MYKRQSLEAADASLRTAKLNLAFTKITSPVTGIAGIAKAQIGDLLSPSMPTELTTVSTVDPIKVYFNISEREYLKVAGERTDSSKQVPLELFLVDEMCIRDSRTTCSRHRTAWWTCRRMTPAAKHRQREMAGLPARKRPSRVLQQRSRPRSSASRSRPWPSHR